MFPGSTRDCSPALGSTVPVALVLPVNDQIVKEPNLDDAVSSGSRFEYVCGISTVSRVSFNFMHIWVKTNKRDSRVCLPASNPQLCRISQINVSHRTNPAGMPPFEPFMVPAPRMASVYESSCRKTGQGGVLPSRGGRWSVSSFLWRHHQRVCGF